MLGHRFGGQTVVGETGTVPNLRAVSVGFTDRSLTAAKAPFGGNLAAHVGDDVGNVKLGRETLLQRTGADRLVFVRQVHGRDVARVDSCVGLGVVQLDAAADALVTDAPGTALAVVVADCLPVACVDADAGVVGAAHAGRPGLVAGVLQATLAAMVELGADQSRMQVTIGPGICGQCYEVPVAMRDEVDALLPGSATTTRAGTPGLDLRAGAIAQLQRLGVGDIRRVDRCTAEDPTLFSYRRDARTGRFAGWIALT